MWIVIHRVGRLRPHGLPIGARWTVGRDSGVDLVVADPSVSRRHLLLERTDEGVFIVDLDSSNGTLVNGQEIEGRWRLGAGDKVEIGGSAFWVHAASEATDTPAALPSHTDFLDMLADEAARSRAFGDAFGLLLLEARNASDMFFTRTVRRVAGAKRDVDRLATYSPKIIEAIFPQIALADLQRRVAELVDGGEADEPPLRAAALWVASPDSPDALIAEAMELLRTVRHGKGGYACRAHGTAPSDEGPAETTEPLVVSDEMRQVMNEVAEVARSEIGVLVRGPTGAGKELVARAIHHRGPRRAGPFVAVNCAAIPQHLLASTLFGHVEGAFTDARGDARGLFRAADGGSLFLDEVAELPTEAQAALLRCLDDKRVRPVGSTSEIPVDVRVVAATHRDLEEQVGAGGFRRDLYFRLSGVEIEVPPLARRTADILPLARHFLQQVRVRAGVQAVDFDEQACALLLQHAWPGNVRELRNVVEHAALNAHGDTITALHLSSRIVGVDDTADDDDLPRFKHMVEQFERELLLQALRRANWNRSEVSRRLGIPPRTLTNKLKRYGLREGD